jgi:3-methyladenine DNA glycosylase AlkD
VKPEQVLQQLAACGTPQNRKAYARHGAREPMSGCSYASLYALQKAIGQDAALAAALWRSGNHDARVLATLVADPEALPASLLDAWVQDVDNHILCEALARAAARSPDGFAVADRWRRQKDEWRRASGFTLLGQLAADPAQPDATFAALLPVIEAEIRGSANFARHAMYLCLIAIGSRGGALQSAAVAAAKRIGKVEIDHGQTGCKTPDAIPYIEKTVAHRSKQAAKHKGSRSASSASRSGGAAGKKLAARTTASRQPAAKKAAKKQRPKQLLARRRAGRA